LDPAADEVMDWRWIPWTQLRVAAALPWSISPWACQQIPLLDAAGIPVEVDGAGADG
jgi:isopentenyl-diphosphate delta-isomerase